MGTITQKVFGVFSLAVFALSASAATPAATGLFANSPGAKASCSPEVKTKNLAVVEKTLNDLMSNPKFADAKLLSVTVQKIRSDKEIDSRIASYLALVGVDARSPEAAAEFVGARDFTSYELIAQKQLGLNAEQSNMLMTSLSEALLANINK